MKTEEKHTVLLTALRSIREMMEEQIDNKANGGCMQYVKTFQTCIDEANTALWSMESGE